MLRGRFLSSLLCVSSVLVCACSSVVEHDIALVPAVFVKAEGDLSKGTKPFQGIPTIATTIDGKRQFLAWYGNGDKECGKNYLMMSYADNNQWQNKVDVVVRSPYNGKVRLFDPVLWRAPDNSIYLFWAQSAGKYYNQGEWSFVGDGRSNGWAQYDRRGGVWFSVCKNPHDKNPQWSKPTRIANGVMMNKPIVLSNGKWMLPIAEFQLDCFNDFQTLNEGAKVYIADAGIKNVKCLNNVKIPHSPFPEHMFVEKRDGTIWLLARTQPDNMLVRSHGKTPQHITYANNGILEAFSKDGGVQFGKLKPSSIPHVGSRFHIYRLKSGKLLLVKNDADDASWLAGKPRSAENVSHYSREKIMVYISDDDGKTWEGGLMLDSRKGVSYPDASQDDNGNIYICWDFSRYNEREILVAKITEADILKKQISSTSQSAEIANKAK